MGNYGQCNTLNANMADLSADRPESSCTRARLVRPQEFCSDLAIESINVVHFELLRAWVPPKMRFYSSWNFTFLRSFHKESWGFMRFGAAMGSTVQEKCAHFTCFRREDSQKYLNERIFARDGAVPWYLHGLLFIRQKVNILENRSIRCGPWDLLDSCWKQLH